MIKTPRVAIINYGMGNVSSVISALKYLGAEVDLVKDPELLSNYHYIVLPGVGSFNKAMERLRQGAMDQAIVDCVKHRSANILGICLGMQLLVSKGMEHGETDGLGLLPGVVDRFKKNDLQGYKIPHVGFNAIKISESSGLFKDIPDYSDFYFTHSYRLLAADVPVNRSALCSYGIEFLAAFEVDNICGAQFHPEKSQTNGLIMLRNFLKYV